MASTRCIAGTSTPGRFCCAASTWPSTLGRVCDRAASTLPSTPGCDCASARDAGSMHHLCRRLPLTKTYCCCACSVARWSIVERIVDRSSNCRSSSGSSIDRRAIDHRASLLCERGGWVGGDIGWGGWGAKSARGATGSGSSSALRRRLPAAAAVPPVSSGSPFLDLIFDLRARGESSNS